MSWRQGPCQHSSCDRMSTPIPIMHLDGRPAGGQACAPFDRRWRPAPVLKVLDLFSGIGGFSLGLERTGGFETVAFCEINPFCRAVLAKHWPTVRQYSDVRELTADLLAADGIAVDVITGGFPCQDISVAGAQAGMGDGTRSGLWSEIARLAGDLRPEFIILENVSNLLGGPSGRPGGWFGRVLGDLAEIGYDAEWHCIPASYLGAWHRRDRVWVVAYSNGDGRREGISEEPLVRQRHLSQCAPRVSPQWPGRSDLPAPTLSGARDGLPRRVDRIASLGNAVVPQIPEMIGRAILEARNTAAPST